MKSKKLFSRLFPTYFIISLLGIVILIFITRFTLRNFYFQETKKNLIQKANLIKPEIIKSLTLDDQDSINHTIKRYADFSEDRMTIILTDGTVVGDSKFNYQKMENHKNREEVIVALRGELGESMRHSPTLNETHLYIALPLYDVNKKIIGVLRNAVSVDYLKVTLRLLIEKVAIWGLLLLIILTYLIYIQAKKISAPLEELKRQVGDFARGDFLTTIEVTDDSTEEVSALAKEIGAMSKKLKTQLDKINKQRNEQLAVFTSMLEGVITIYPDLNIYHINNSALRLFNYTKTPGTFKGIPLMDVVQNDDVYELAKDLILENKTIEKEIVHSNGKVLNIHGTILQSNETGMIGGVLVFNDVTKMRELENHRTEFVANVSHELKTPLTAIQGYLETLSDVDDEKTRNKFLGIMSNHSNRLKTIINDLLALSSIEKDSEVGDLKLDFTEISPLVENIINLCQDSAIKKNISILFNRLDIKLALNPPLFEQALINLLDNAIKYGPKNSQVIVDISIQNSHIELAIQDFGQGIAEEHHDRLFERFYSVDKARSRELGGSGLGLSIVKHIVLSHHGSIRVESEVGKGSRFVISLPWHNL